MKKAVSSGGIVIRKTNGSVEMLLVYSSHFNSWIIPKGHVNKGETVEEAARREVMEETGLENVKLLSKLGVITRESMELSKEVVEKDIHIFTFSTNVRKETKPMDRSEGQEKTRWFEMDEGIRSLYFEPDREFLKNHRKEIKL